MNKNAHQIRFVLFILSGMLLMIASTFLRNKSVDWLEALLLNLGIVIIATMLIEYMCRLCGGTPIENQVSSLSSQVDRLSKSIDVIEAIEQSGLMGVADRLGNYGTQNDWIQLVANANTSIDFMGRTMHGWASYDGMAELLIRKMRDGVSFRWLLMSTENPFQAMLTEEGAEIDPVLRQKRDVVLQMLRRVIHQLPENLRPQLQIRLFKHVPLYSSIVRIDDTTYWSPYLCSNQAQNCPLMIVRGPSRGWAQLLAQEFQSVWNYATPLSATEGPSNHKE